MEYWKLFPNKYCGAIVTFVSYFLFVVLFLIGIQIPYWLNCFKYITSTLDRRIEIENKLIVSATIHQSLVRQLFLFCFIFPFSRGYPMIQPEKRNAQDNTVLYLRSQKSDVASNKYFTYEKFHAGMPRFLCAVIKYKIHSVRAFFFPEKIQFVA